MKRIGIIFIALCVVMSCLSLPVSANEGDATVVEFIVGDVSGEEESADALEETEDSETREDVANSKEVESESEEKDNSEETRESEENNPESMDETEEDDLFEPSDIVWSEEKTLTEDLVVNGNLTVEKELDLNGHKLTVNGNMITSASVLTQDTGELVVNGNYVQKDGFLESWSGSIITISGDLRIQDINSSGEYVNGKGSLFTYGVINIGGDLVFQSSYNDGFDYFYGTYNVGGNFIDKSPCARDWFCHLHFTGDNTHLFDISTENRYYACHISSEAGVISVPEYFYGTLESALTINCLNGTLKIENDLNLNGNALTVNGDVIATETVDFGNNGELIVNGDYCQKKKCLEMDEVGTIMTVSGDLRFQDINSSGSYVVGTGYISSGSYSELNVGGDFVYQSSYDSGRSYGTYNIGGNFTDKKGRSWYSKIQFNGECEHIVEATSETVFEGGIASDSQNLTVTNNFNGTLNNSLTLFSEADKIYSEKGININENTLIIKKSLESSGVIEFGNNGEMLVEGDFIQKSGHINMDYVSTKLDVKGDLRIQGINKSGKPVIGEGYIDTGRSSDPGYNLASEIKVGKNFVYQSSKFTSWNFAYYDIGGDFTDMMGKEWNGIFTLSGDADEINKQTINIGSGKIYKLILLSCGDYYVIPDGCCSNIERPDHDYDNGKVTKATTKTTKGEKTYTCKACGHTRIEPISRVQDIFSDISGSEWYVEAVQYAYENDIMAGMGSGFKPTANLSREQLTQMLYSVEGKPDVIGENPFSDVKEGVWYASSVLWAKQNGIADGKSDGSFGVGNPITRQDLAMMLYKYATLKGYKLNKDDSAITGYKDTNKVSAYAKDAMNWAVTNGIISGKSDKGAPKAETRLDPAGKASRAECAAMLKKLIENNK